MGVYVQSKSWGERFPRSWLGDLDDSWVLGWAVTSLIYVYIFFFFLSILSHFYCDQMIHLSISKYFVSKQWHLKIWSRFYLVFKVDPFNLEGCDGMCFILLSCHREGVAVRNYQCWARWTRLGVNLKIWRELLWNVLSFYLPLAKHCRHRWTKLEYSMNEPLTNERAGFLFFFQCFIFIYLPPHPPKKRVLIFHFVLWCSLWLIVVLFLTESTCIFLLYKWRKCFQIHPSTHLFSIYLLYPHLGHRGLQTVGYTLYSVPVRL